MRIVIEASILGDGSEGGIQPVIVSLAQSLAQFPQDEYIFVTGPRSSWLEPFLGPNQKIVKRPRRPQKLRDRFKQALGPFAHVATKLVRIAKQVLKVEPMRQPLTFPQSDGFIESLQPDLVHIPYPDHYAAFNCPTVVSLFDLQHRHYPEFFGAHLLKWREITYGEAFARALRVVTPSEFVRKDVASKYAISPEKISVVGLKATVTDGASPSREEMDVFVTENKIPERFCLFPAVNYVHKNHIRLLHAVKRLKDEGNLTHRVVCTGAKKLNWPQIEIELDKLGLREDVLFLGYVENKFLKGLLERATFLIFPSLFEGGTQSILDALEAGLPVACSDILTNQEYAGDAALYFDGLNETSIYDAMKKISTDSTLRQQLAKKGFAHAQNFTLSAMGKGYREVYETALAQSRPTAPERKAATR